jgi:GUN4-like/Caspase domain
MKKVALLIGVSKYADSDLKALPAAVKDVLALQEVLQRPDVGGFDPANITVLQNPDRQQMEEAIDQVFHQVQKDDLILFYFSGHGLIDPGNGDFYFSTHSTRKRDNRPIPTTAVSPSFIHRMMGLGECRSRRQVVILDCCYAASFVKGLPSKDDGTVQVAMQLGGEGRAVLTASTSTQYAYEQPGFELSIYTHYLVEGLAKGAADLNDDGAIDAYELHEYVREQVKEAAPNMTPEFYGGREGHTIVVAASPKDDPQLRYRKQVRGFAQEDEGEIDLINRYYLEDFQRQLGLTEALVQQIETEELEPYRQRKAKVQRYQEVFSQAIERQFPLSEGDRMKLKRFQQLLSLRDEDVEWIEGTIRARKKVQPQAFAVKPPHPTNISRAASHESEDVLNSEKGIDYTWLRNSLKAQKWVDADRETYRVMITVVGKIEGDWLTKEELLKFPCVDLKTIDGLWVKYSQGRFGFSVQKRIYMECGGRLDGKYDGPAWEKFGDRVRWRTKGDWIYDYGNLTKDACLSSPKGIFPFYFFGFDWFYVVKRGFGFSRSEQTFMSTQHFSLLSNKDL